jgi:integrase
MLARSGSLSPYVIELAIETAMRRGELASLEWQDIDFQRSLARLHETKSGESRDVPLSPTALQTLRALQAVTGPNGPVLRMRPDSITQAFSRACRQARVNNLRFHDLRHEAASRLVELGLSTIEVSAVTGHKSMQMLKRYTQLRAPDLAAKIAGLSASGTGG